MSARTARTARPRPSRSALAGALLAVALLAAGCGGADDPAPAGGATSSAVSDGGGASDGGAVPDGGGTSDGGGGQSAAPLPVEPYPVTPAPEGFTPPDACSGEGAYFVEVGGAATPALPERADESLTIALSGIDGADAQLTATIGDGEPRPIEDITLGETVTIDLWTLSVTSVCDATQQVEFDLID